MSIAVASFESTLTSFNPSFTKPAGLAVGDLLIVMICNENTSIPTGPAGWTLLTNSSTAGAPFDPLSAILYKVADSSDVAASTFSFSGASSAAVLMHVTGLSPTLLFSDSESVFFNPSGGSGRIDVSFDFDLTPAASGELFFGIIAGTDTGGTANGHYTNFRLNDGTAITEMFERSATNISATFFYGIQTVSAPLTSLVVDVDIDNGGITEYASSFGTLTPRVNVVSETNLLETSPTFFATDAMVSANANANFHTASPTFPSASAFTRTTTRWTNETKPSTTWTNEQQP